VFCRKTNSGTRSCSTTFSRHATKPRWQDALGDGTAVPVTQAGIKTRFTMAAGLMLTLTRAHTQNNLKAVIHEAIKAHRLLIIDEIWLPLMKWEQGNQGNLFFQVIAALYERSSLIGPSNLPSGH
jgi:DNA replication protein DnaC